MLTVRRVSYDVFDRYSLSIAKGNFHQTAAMGMFRETMGWEVHPLLIYDDDNDPVGGLILAGKNGRFEVTMGPLLDYKNQTVTAELLKALTAYAGQIGAAELELFPCELHACYNPKGLVEGESDRSVVDMFLKNGWRHHGFTVGYGPTVNRWMFTKDLSGLKNEADLLASYRQTTRQTVRKLDMPRYSVKKISYGNLAVVKQLIDSSCQKNSLDCRPLDYYERLYKSFGESIEFLVVYYDQTIPIATGVFIHHPSETVYFMSGTDTRYRSLYGGHFLQHYEMCRCIEQGVKRYNFYGVSGHFTDNPLLVYKAGFRGVVEEYVGGFSKTISPRRALFMKIRRRTSQIKPRPASA